MAALAAPAPQMNSDGPATSRSAAWLAAAREARRAPVVFAFAQVLPTLPGPDRRLLVSFH
jgi:hypothetical protein